VNSEVSVGIGCGLGVGVGFGKYSNFSVIKGLPSVSRKRDVKRRTNTNMSRAFGIVAIKLVLIFF